MYNLDKFIKDPLKLLFIILWFFGLVHWYLFINYGLSTFISFDWRHVHQWLDVICKAWEESKIPFYASYYREEYLTGNYIWGNKYFSTPYWISSPQIIIGGAFLNPRQLITLQVLLNFSFSTFGLYLWSKKLKLSIAASICLFLLISMNGYIIAKMGVGHIQNTGYFLIPVFLLILYKFIDPTKDRNLSIISIMLIMSIFLSYVIMQGALHNWYQFVFVGSIILIFYRKIIKYYFGSVILSILMCSYYFIPNILYSKYTGGTRSMRHEGFGLPLPWDSQLIDMETLSTFSKFIVNPINIIHHLIKNSIVKYNPINDGIWEQNMYVGIVGLILIGLSLIFAIIKYKIEIKSYILGFFGLIFCIYPASAFCSIYSANTPISYFRLNDDYTINNILFISGALIVCFIVSINFINNSYKFNKYSIWAPLIGLSLVLLLSMYPVENIMINILQKLDIFLADNIPGGSLFFYPGIDRIPTRLAIYPLTALIIFSSTHFENIFRIFGNRFYNLNITFFISAIIYMTITNSYNWFHSIAEQQFNTLEQSNVIFKTMIYDINGMDNYKYVMTFSFIFSLLFFLIILFIFNKMYHQSYNQNRPIAGI